LKHLGLLHVYLDRILDQDWRPETVPDEFPYTSQEKVEFRIGRIKNFADALNGLNTQFQNAGQVLEMEAISGKIGERVYGEVKISSFDKLAAEFSHGSPSFVDLGCGRGILSLYLSGMEKFGQAIGFEIDNDAAKIARVSQQNIYGKCMENLSVFWF
jgi:hypothetical protein